jgi:hypothetical protein
MTVGRLVATPAEARATFVALRRLSERLRTRPGTRLGPEVSMGMSGDYTVAVEEGATLVRVGTALFGARTPAAVDGAAGAAVGAVGEGPAAVAGDDTARAAGDASTR